MEAVVKKFFARPLWFLELHTHSYQSICRRIYRIKFAFFKFTWNLFPAWAKAAKYTKRNCNNRRMLFEVGEPLFVIRRLTLRPLIEYRLIWISQTNLRHLKELHWSKKHPIWYAFGPSKEVSFIYLFIFLNSSDILKKNERSGKHVQHLEVFLLFNLVHCSMDVIVTFQPFLNTPFPSSKPPPPPFCPSFLAMNPINEEESKKPFDNINAQPMASC